MSPDSGFVSRNHLLNALSTEDLGQLVPHLKRVSLAVKEVVIEPDVPIRHVHFMEHGLLSIIAHPGSERPVEVGIAGQDGISGLPLVFGVQQCPFEVFVQVAGDAHRMSAEAFRTALIKSPSFHALMLRYANAFLTQTAGTAHANGRYTVHERLARWLLMSHDRSVGDTIALTHEFFSLMLGVRRASVTTTMNDLERDGLVRGRRGSVEILDRAKLKKLAGESYGVPESEYQALIGSPITA